MMTGALDLINGLCQPIPFLAFKLLLAYWFQRAPAKHKDVEGGPMLRGREQWCVHVEF